jgi:hypothetical protein
VSLLARFFTKNDVVFNPFVVSFVIGTGSLLFSPPSEFVSFLAVAPFSSPFGYNVVLAFDDPFYYAVEFPAVVSFLPGS